MNLKPFWDPWFDPRSLLFWPYLLSSALVAALVVRRQLRRQGKRVSSGTVFTGMISRQFVQPCTRSQWLDFKFYPVNSTVLAWVAATVVVSQENLASRIFAALQSAGPGPGDGVRLDPAHMWLHTFVVAAVAPCAGEWLKRSSGTPLRVLVEVPALDRALHHQSRATPDSPQSISGSRRQEPGCHVRRLGLVVRDPPRLPPGRCHQPGVWTRRPAARRARLGGVALHQPPTPHRGSLASSRAERAFAERR